MTLFRLAPLPALLLLAACSGKDGDDTGGGTDTSDTSTDTADTADTTDTAETGDTDTGETGDTDTGETGDTDTGETGDTDTGHPPISYAEIIQPIFDGKCVSCHGTSGGLTLVDGYANLVGVDSTEAAGMKLVVAGDPDSSYLINKIMGTQADVGGSGVQMPKDGAALDPGSMSAITQWIVDGALP